MKIVPVKKKNTMALKHSKFTQDKENVNCNYTETPFSTTRGTKMKEFGNTLC